MYRHRFFLLLASAIIPFCHAQKNEAAQTLLPDSSQMDAIIITGSLKPEHKERSAIVVDTYTPSFFRKTPSASLFEALQLAQGVRPQVNCNICNTGDIQINGLEGPYTLILIDGMPLVSGLSSVYGLTGIPTALIERIEIVKGPTSALYGSEAVGGLIQVVTKKAASAPSFGFDQFVSDKGEINTDLGFKRLWRKRLFMYTGIHHFYFQHRLDNNLDQFTDVALQHRLSVFQKWQFQRKSNRNLQWAARFFTEDRWGGDIQWSPRDRGGQVRYGESIYTHRLELFGQYQLPVNTPVHLSVSASGHNQNSYYGTTPFMAQQRILFGQITAHPTPKSTDLLLGISWRYTYYADNTKVAQPMAIHNPDASRWSRIFSNPRNLPGLFAQWERSFPGGCRSLFGIRLDHHAQHGKILTPRLAFKHKLGAYTVRWNMGTGFRVVNVFTEDHAALTGARNIVIDQHLQPEKSINYNIQLQRHNQSIKRITLGREFSIFYTHFQNRIVPNYNINPNEIHYSNLLGYGYCRGVSGKLDLQLPNISISASLTWLNTALVEHGEISVPLLTEKCNAQGTVAWKIPHTFWLMDYTVSVCSPMALPLLGPLDPRPPFSPWWAIHNLQWTWGKETKHQVYFGVKNLFNFTPNRGTPFLIARSGDPFDKRVVFDVQGNPQATADNPYALTFDPSYVYAPNQGRRIYFGLRFKIE